MTGVRSYRWWCKCLFRFGMKFVWAVMAILILVLETEAQNTGQGISLSLTPANGITAPGHDVTFTCAVDLNILSNNLVVWTRRVSTIHTKIAVGTIKQDDFLENDRYKLSTTSAKANKKHFTLTIADVQFEDTSTIECAILHSSRKDTKVLAVCDDPSSGSCSCVKRTGWSSPQCYGESKSVKELQKAFDRTVAGLGVCFAIAVIYGIVVTVFFARDCMKVIYERNQLKLAKIKNQQRGYNPYVDSDRLAVDDDLGSIPESGVWSQSDGRNGSDRSAGRAHPVQTGRARPREDQLAGREYAATTTQSHSNPAFNPDDVSGEPPLYDKLTGIATRPMGGVRPKVPQQQMQSRPEDIPPYPEASRVENHGPYSYSEPHPSRGCSNPEPSPYPFVQPAEPYRRYGNDNDPSAPSSARSERSMAPERPPPPQQSYTDIPAEKHPSGQHNGYSSPRRLEFGPSSGLDTGRSAP